MAIEQKKTHELKLLEIYFNPVRDKKMNFQIRKNDRKFKEKDFLLLREWNGEEYTGREIKAEIIYITSLHMEVDYVCMGIRLIEQERTDK